MVVLYTGQGQPLPVVDEGLSAGRMIHTPCSCSVYIDYMLRDTMYDTVTHMCTDFYRECFSSTLTIMVVLYTGQKGHTQGSTDSSLVTKHA
eukprot:1786908-Amphidinium_carterae.1